VPYRCAPYLGATMANAASCQRRLGDVRSPGLSRSPGCCFYDRVFLAGQRDLHPVATGVVAAADSWACSNPANGRGASIGMLHALTLRDQLRVVGLDDPTGFTDAFYTATAEAVEPWYRTTLTSDRHRLGEIEAGLRGAAYDSPDPAYQLEKALDEAYQQDPDCLRAYFDILLVLRTPEEVFARPGLRDRTLELGSGWRQGSRSARPASSSSRWPLPSSAAQEEAT